MCGIAGTFLLDRSADAAAVAAVLRMLDAERHRGPDDWGILVPESVAARLDVRALLEPRGLEHVRTYPAPESAPVMILGARRLSIIDLSPRGRMPMGTADRRVWIAYNGEVYNYRELRAELRARGHVFESDTDTETILHGYVEWGADVVTHLRGMFGVALFDARAPASPRVLLARDRFGIKPLYWARRSSTLHFASEVRALMAGGGMPDEPEPRGFHGFLVHGSVPSPWTTVRDVLSLPAAHTLVVDRRTYSYPRPVRYWTLATPPAGVGSPTDAVTQTRRLLDEAVRQHLVSDVPLGVFLSGGLDSSAVTALAARHVSQPLTTVSVTFDEAEFSEGDYAERVARRVGAKHVEVRVRAADFAAAIPAIFAAMDQPSIDGVNSYFIAKAAREAGLTVVLSGLGADEIFWGYPGFRVAPRVARVARVPGVRWLAGLVARLAARRRGSWEKLDFLRERGPLAAYLAVRGLFPPARAARLLDAGLLPLSADPSKSPVTPERYGAMEAEYYLQDQLLRDTDVFAMAHSIEVRVPFLDHRLADYVAALPPEAKLSRSGSKPLLRAAVAPELSDETLQRAKMGFTFPFQEWMRSVEAAAVPAVPRLQLNPRESARVWRTFRTGRTHWSRAWALSVLGGMAHLRRLPAWQPGRDPRRLLFLLSEVYGSKGGIQSYNQSLLRAVGEALPASEIRVVSANDTAMPPTAGAAGRLFFFGCGPRTSSWRKARLTARVWWEALLHRPDELVCGHINFAPLAWALRWLGIRMSLVAHGIDVWAPPRRLRAAARGMDRVLAVSRYTAARMNMWGVERARLNVLPDTVDGEAFRPVADGHADGRAPVLLTVARLDAAERSKGVDQVIGVLPALRERFPGIRYAVAGTGNDIERLLQLATAGGVADAVQFLGAVTDEELPALLSRSDLFVMPSRKEGFGIVFIEALACGTPVIGCGLEGSSDALLDGRVGTLIDTDAPGQLQAAIVAALSKTCAAPLLDGRRLREETLAAFGSDRFRQLVRETLGRACAA
jgi:asparagine synthase (glutamine-hydrolysing)